MERAKVDASANPDNQLANMYFKSKLDFSRTS